MRSIATFDSDGQELIDQARAVTRANLLLDRCGEIQEGLWVIRCPDQKNLKTQRASDLQVLLAIPALPVRARYRRQMAVSARSRRDRRHADGGR